MQGKQRSSQKIKRRKLLVKVKANKRGEDPPLNQLLQRDLTVSNLIGDEPLTTSSAIDTGKGCVKTQRLRLLLLGCAREGKSAGNALQGWSSRPLNPAAFSPTS